jgi:hypothetical protein
MRAMLRSVGGKHVLPLLKYMDVGLRVRGNCLGVRLVETFAATYIPD